MEDLLTQERMPRKKATSEEEAHAEGRDNAVLKTAVVDQLRARLMQSVDMQALRPALAAAVAQRLLDDGIADKLSVEGIVESVAASLGRELAQEDAGLRAMIVDELVARLVG